MSIRGRPEDLELLQRGELLESQVHPRTRALHLRFVKPDERSF